MLELTCLDTFEHACRPHTLKTSATHIHEGLRTQAAYTLHEVVLGRTRLWMELVVNWTDQCSQTWGSRRHAFSRESGHAGANVMGRCGEAVKSLNLSCQWQGLQRPQQTNHNALLSTSVNIQVSATMRETRLESKTNHASRKASRLKQLHYMLGLYWGTLTSLELLRVTSQLLAVEKFLGHSRALVTSWDSSWLRQPWNLWNLMKPKTSKR